MIKSLPIRSTTAACPSSASRPSQGSWQQWIAAFSLKPDDIVKNTAPSGGAIIDRMVLTVVPQPGAVIAGALLLVPFGSSTIRMLRRNRGSAIA